MLKISPRIGKEVSRLKPKVVHHYDNTDNPDTCFVRLFKRYQQLLPPDRPKNVFYFKPLKNPTTDTWFSARPIGHNTLEHTVARLCSAAGIQGFRTNHSLCATAATRLYQAGVDEQLIMETTGHRSLEGVRSYKRTSEDQKTSPFRHFEHSPICAIPSSSTHCKCYLKAG